MKSEHERIDTGCGRVPLRPRWVITLMVLLVFLTTAFMQAPPVAAEVCLVDPPTLEEIARALEHAITSRSSHIDCFGDISGCEKRTPLVGLEFDSCSAIIWLLDQAVLEPANEAYEYQFPGCYPPGCVLSPTANAAQVDPDDRTAPFYKGPSMPRCYRDDICLVAEYGEGMLYGWNGTSTIQCTPGTKSTSALAPPACVRNGVSIGPTGSGQVLPTIVAIHVPFMECRDYSFVQTVSAELIQGPKGETYRLDPVSKESPPRKICNSMRSSSTSAGG